MLCALPRQGLRSFVEFFDLGWKTSLLNLFVATILSRVKTSLVLEWPLFIAIGLPPDEPQIGAPLHFATL